MKYFPKNNAIQLLKIAAISVFAGRAYQHIFWDAPYREIIWDPVWTGWAVRLFSDMSWDEFVTHPNGDAIIQKAIVLIGLFYLLAMFAVFYIKKWKKLGGGIIYVGAIGLVILAAVYAKDKFFHIGQFFEYSLQFCTPLFFVYLAKKEKPSHIFLWIVKIAIALTFICHGLYALGYYPYPGTFMTMTQNILGLSENTTIQFLNGAGILDFIVAVGIFLPGKWGRAALIYCVVWGLLTSLARIVGNFYFEYPLESLHQWVYEAVYRVPHFLVPLWVVFFEKNKAGRSDAF